MRCCDEPMIDPKNLGIPVWMGVTRFRGPNHKVATAAGVYCVPVATDVIRRIVDRELFC